MAVKIQIFLYIVSRAGFPCFIPFQTDPSLARTTYSCVEGRHILNKSRVEGDNMHKKGFWPHTKFNIEK